MILYMLDIKSNKKQIINYFIMSIFFLIFSSIYEYFSHGVFSSYMMYAFLIPFLLGSLIYEIIYLTKSNKYLNKFAMKIYNCSILTFTLGSIMKGFLDIYGTTNNLINVYSKLGIILIIVSIIVNVLYNLKSKKIKV